MPICKTDELHYMGLKVHSSLRLRPVQAPLFLRTDSNNSTLIPRCISITFRSLFPLPLRKPFERLCTFREDEAIFLCEQSSGVHEQEFLHWDSVASTIFWQRHHLQSVRNVCQR